MLPESVVIRTEDSLVTPPEPAVNCAYVENRLILELSTYPSRCKECKQILSKWESLNYF